MTTAPLPQASEVTTVPGARISRTLHRTEAGRGPGFGGLPEREDGVGFLLVIQDCRSTERNPGERLGQSFQRKIARLSANVASSHTATRPIPGSSAAALVSPWRSTARVRRV